jgi:hypothetical protein
MVTLSTRLVAPLPQIRPVLRTPNDCLPSHASENRHVLKNSEIKIETSQFKIRLKREYEPPLIQVKGPLEPSLMEIKPRREPPLMQVNDMRTYNVFLQRNIAAQQNQFRICIPSNGDECVTAWFMRGLELVA